MQLKQALVESMAEIELFGGVACLDFANSLDGRATAAPEEYLTSYAALVDWSRLAGLIDQPAARRLARADDAAGDAALEAARTLREAIFQVFVAVGRGQTAPAGPLETIRVHYRDAISAARLVGDEAGDGFRWQFDADDPGRAWWPAAVSAVELLTHGPLDRVKVCASRTGCIGLFLDTSKN